MKRAALPSVVLMSVSGVFTKTTLGTQTGGSIIPATPCGDCVMAGLVCTDKLESSLVLLSLGTGLGLGGEGGSWELQLVYLPITSSTRYKSKESNNLVHWPRNTINLQLPEC